MCTHCREIAVTTLRRRGAGAPEQAADAAIAALDQMLDQARHRGRIVEDHAVD
ncbi:hypothetical protein D3C73_845290 [compost metagenome]